jgi:hypothetical protein
MFKGMLEFAPVVSYLVIVALCALSDLSAIAAIRALPGITALRASALPQAVLSNVALNAPVYAGQLLQTLLNPLADGDGLLFDRAHRQ